MKQSTKNFLSSSLALTAFALVAAVILTAANFFLYVEPVRGLTPEKKARLATICDATDFTELDISELPEDAAIFAAYRAKGGKDDGMIILETKNDIIAKGVFRGTMYMLVAIKEDGTVNGITTDRVENDKGFFDNPLIDKNFGHFIGKGSDNLPSETGEFNSEDYTNATFTLQGLLDAVNKAVEYHQNNLDGLKTAPEKSYGEEVLPDVYLSIELSLASPVAEGGTAEILVKMTGYEGFAPIGDNTVCEVSVTKDGAGYGKNITIESENRVYYSIKLEDIEEGEYTVKVSVTSAAAGFIDRAVEEFSFMVYSYDPTIVNPLRAALKDNTVTIYDVEGTVDGIKVYTVGEKKAYSGAAHAADENFSADFMVYVSFDGQKIHGVGVYITGGNDYFDIPQSWLDGFFDGKDAGNIELPVSGEEMSGATYSSNAIYNAVAKICEYYLGLGG